ncbi:MAG: aminotransferase class IV [Nitrospinota bacterium]
MPQVIEAGEALRRLEEALHPGASNYLAMYSSRIDAIIRDPHLMSVPLDDHLVHRGDGVFDTCTIRFGKAYQLEEHLDRFLRSAALAKISPPFERARLREIILRTAAAAGRPDAVARYFLSRGVGGFAVDPGECLGSSFYVVITSIHDYPERYYREGMRVVTTGVAIKAPYFARTKSTNYLPNVHIEIEAIERGADSGLMLDERGFVAEGSNKNVAFVNGEDIFETPSFDRILQGVTITRLLHLAERLKREGLLRDIRVRDISPEEGLRAKEMMFTGSGIRVAPIVEWDGKKIGKGVPGPVAKALAELLEEDMREGEGQLTPVPYELS